jgi:hypothetical protein
MTTLLPDDLISFLEASKELDVEVGALHRWRDVNDMPAWRKGGRWFVSRREFTAWTAKRSGRDQLSAITPAARRREQIRAHEAARKLLHA